MPITNFLSDFFSSHFQHKMCSSGAVEKNIVIHGQPHIVLIWHSSSFCSPITASKLCTRECELPATFIFRQNARAEYTNVQRSAAFSFFMHWHFQISLCSATFLTNCTEHLCPTHFTKLLYRIFRSKVV